MSSLVVDASVAVAWFLPLVETERANAILRSGDHLFAPELVIAEIANAAWKAATFHGTPPQAAKEIVREASRFFSELVPLTALKNRALVIALELRHPIYDCFYLALAEMRDIEFITADDRLLRRCATTPFSARTKAL
jgi:predicted nucleic acid-binding protein